jgi:FkbM family methyltransferase
MKKVFIDCGAHTGSSIRYFRKTFKDSKEYEIWSFEASSQLIGKARNEVGDHAIHAAVWIEDGEVDFYEVGTTGAGTMNEKKAKWNVDPEERKKRKVTKKKDRALHKNQKKVRVKSIDLDRWIKENFQSDDYIILKLDVEGSEYEILDHMIENGSVDYINELYIEFHIFKCDVDPSENVRLTKILNNKGIPVKEWDAQSY